MTPRVVICTIWSTLHQPWNYGNTSKTTRTSEDLGGKGKGCMNVIVTRILAVDDSIEVNGGYVTRSQVTGSNPLEGFTKSSCKNCDLAARSRLPTLKRGRGSSWEPRD